MLQTKNKEAEMEMTKENTGDKSRVCAYLLTQIHTNLLKDKLIKFPYKKIETNYDEMSCPRRHGCSYINLQIILTSLNELTFISKRMMCECFQVLMRQNETGVWCDYMMAYSI